MTSMRLRSVVFLLAAILGPLFSNAQQSPAQQAPTATLHELHVDGLKHLKEEQVTALTGLKTGSQVSKSDLQDAADVLRISGA